MSVSLKLENVNQSSNCVTKNSKMHRCDNYSAYSVCAIPKLIFITRPRAITLFCYYFRKFVKSLNLSLRTRKAHRVAETSQGLPFIHSSFFKHGSPSLIWAPLCSCSIIIAFISFYINWWVGNIYSSPEGAASNKTDLFRFGKRSRDAHKWDHQLTWQIQQWFWAK